MGGLISWPHCTILCNYVTFLKERERERERERGREGGRGGRESPQIGKEIEANSVLHLHMHTCAHINVKWKC